LPRSRAYQFEARGNFVGCDVLSVGEMLSESRPLAEDEPTLMPESLLALEAVQRSEASLGNAWGFEQAILIFKEPEAP
jgi:hypothetical protein